MKILIVKPILPWPPNQGTRRVTMALLRALAPHHHVDLAVPLQSPAQESDARNLEEETGCRVIRRLAPNRRSPAHRAWYKIAFQFESLVFGHSPRALYASPGELIREVAAMSGREPYDLVIFEYWYTYRFFTHVRARRKILLAHDAEFEVNQRASRGASAPSARQFWSRTEARRELEACRSVDEVWTLTEEDAVALSRASGVGIDRFHLLPFGVDVQGLSLPPADGGEEILFFGSFLADFNLDALDFLVDEIWPAIRERKPSARMTVAGAGLPEGRVRRLRASGISYRGPVDNVKELYESATVVIIPLRYGGGLRVRLLEAMASSRAVVSTRIGAGSIGRDGIHLLVADGAEPIAAAVCRLLDNPAEARSISTAARRLAESNYSEASASGAIRALAEATLPERPESSVD